MFGRFYQRNKSNISSIFFRSFQIISPDIALFYWLTESIIAHTKLITSHEIIFLFLKLLRRCRSTNVNIHTDAKIKIQLTPLLFVLHVYRTKHDTAPWHELNKAWSVCIIASNMVGLFLAISFGLRLWPRLKSEVFIPVKQIISFNLDSDNIYIVF